MSYSSTPKFTIPKKIHAQYEETIENKPTSYTFGHSKNRLMLSELPRVIMPSYKKHEVVFSAMHRVQLI